VIPHFPNPLFLAIVCFPLLALLFRPFGRKNPMGFRKTIAGFCLLDMILVAGTWFLDRPDSLCVSCRIFSPDELLLSLSLLGSMLPFLLIDGEEDHRGPRPGLILGMLACALFGLNLSVPSAPAAGGALLSGGLGLSALLLSRIFPGAYRGSFFFRLALAFGLLGLLAGAEEAGLLGAGAREILAVAAILLLLPAPFPRKSERVSSPAFLRVDQALFVCIPPLAGFHILRATGEGGTLASPSPALAAACLAFGFLGLLYGKTARFTEDLACGLATAGTGFALAGLLTRTPDGTKGALSLLLLIPLATALSGLALSLLVSRLRVRTFDALSGKGGRFGPLRLSFFLGAFQGMSLPLVGGFQAEWAILKALSELSFLLAIASIAGIFFTFVLVLNRTQSLFMGGVSSGLSSSDAKIAEEISLPEKWSLGMGFALLLLFDLVLSFMGGSEA
jgi:hypothetical protein